MPIERGLTALNSALGEVRNDLLARMNNQHERLINDINRLRNDYINTKAFSRMPLPEADSGSISKTA
jgi:hypothetical protein